MASPVILCELDQNYGFTYAVNHGLRLNDDFRDCLLLNNDCIVAPGFLEELQRGASMPGIGMAVPSQYFYPHTKTMQVHVPYANPAGEVDVNVSMHHANIADISFMHDGGCIELKFAPFFCAYLPHRTLSMIGELNHVAGRHYRSDRLYSSLVTSLGLKILYCPRSRVYHQLQRSTDSLKNADGSDFYKKMFILNTWDRQECRDLGIVLPSWMTPYD